MSLATTVATGGTAPGKSKLVQCRTADHKALAVLPRAPWPGSLEVSRGPGAGAGQVMFEGQFIACSLLFL
ncbi:MULTISPECIES: hypothetical protein [unclassified Pseudomonas]|uniref:hypothetical protein n=1 Tax=unclassified Pseudomonas TaxID=196821 RepID=UPI000A1D5A49|nr:MULTISPECIES: hypothetical protein [unclassified Pseudomonas]